ncbi:MAG TPA: MATE family efflux transporter [Firmicutes bacterium]|nr:MATE family efflux transporter [Bacillota bacterium]
MKRHRIQPITVKRRNAEIDREIVTLAWPAILEMVLHMFVWIVDTAMVGRLGAGALSAVGLGGSVYWTAVWVFAAVGVGATAMVARATGAQDREGASFAGGQGLLLGFGMGVLLAAGTFIVAPWIYRLAGFEREVTAAGIDYIRIVGIGALLFLPLQVGSGILRGSGDTRTPFYITLVTNSINAVGDYALIFGEFGFPALGVKGAAIATLAAHVAGGFLTLWALFRGNRNPLALFYRNGTPLLRPKDIMRVDVPTMRTLLALSGPAGAEEALMNGSRMVTSFMIASLGTVAFAANQVTVAAESLSFMPGYGFAVASGILVGQNLGAGRYDRAMQVGYRSMRYSAMVMGSVGLAFLLIPDLITRAFTNDLRVVRIAAVCLRIAALEQVAIGVTDVLCGSLRGAGDTRTALKITATGTWLVRMPLIAVAIYLVKLTLPAVWGITCLDWAVRAVLALNHFRAGRWRGVKIRPDKREVYESP